MARVSLFPCRGLLENGFPFTFEGLRTMIQGFGHRGSSDTSLLDTLLAVGTRTFPVQYIRVLSRWAQLFHTDIAKQLWTLESPETDPCACHGSTTPYTKTDVLQMVVREYVQQVRHKPWSSQEFTRLNVNLSSIAPDLNPCSISGTMDMLHVYWDTARGYLPMSELYAFTDPGSGPWALEMNLTMPSSLQPCQIEMSTGW